jgi:hypothetical protein
MARAVLVFTGLGLGFLVLGLEGLFGDWAGAREILDGGLGQQFLFLELDGGVECGPFVEPPAQGFLSQQFHTDQRVPN